MRKIQSQRQIVYKKKRLISNQVRYQKYLKKYKVVYKSAGKSKEHWLQQQTIKPRQKKKTLQKSASTWISTRQTYT